MIHDSLDGSQAVVANDGQTHTLIVRFFRYTREPQETNTQTAREKGPNGIHKQKLLNCGVENASNSANQV